MAIDLMANIGRAYSTTALIKNTEKLVFFDFLALALFIIFSSNVGNLTNVLMRKKTNECNLQIVKNIHRAIDETLTRATPEMRAKHNMQKQFNLKTKSTWVYENITNTVITIITQTIQSIVICYYIVSNEPVLIIPIITFYGLMWRYVIPYVTSKRIEKKVDHETMWARVYYAMFHQMTNQINPSFDNHAPDNIDKLMEMIQIFNERSFDQENENYIISLAENCIIAGIAMVIIINEKYFLLVTLLINGSLLFSIIDAYITMKKIENNAEKSTKPLFDMLNEIENDKRKVATQRTISSGIQRIKINSVAFKEIMIDPVEISCRKGGSLLLEGATGCGKSLTLKYLAGLYSGNLCSVTVIGNNGIETNEELSGLLTHRCFVPQTLGDVAKYHGEIKATFGDFYPSENPKESYEEIKDFLQVVFQLRSAVIPSAPDKLFSNTLSGGEVQRFVVASYIWRILSTPTPPDFVILDEIDKALDKDTAVRIMKWIFTNIKSFF
ncbi:MAG: ATP-binding cassette domain-containing protein, partial [Proteobacteria bacterium]|nr:ATP-binding cassette domain-containing protein [Pseudomonadota bacterium]